VKAALRGEKILNDMRESYNNGNMRLQLDYICYNSVMDAWATKGRPEKAEALFLQMCKDAGAGNSAAKPHVSTFNSKCDSSLSSFNSTSFTI
jgi:pentatricopeptide repeat protein